jgi:hypothetical protein
VKKYKFMKMMTAPFLLMGLIKNYVVTLLMRLESIMYLMRLAPD